MNQRVSLTLKGAVQGMNLRSMVKVTALSLGLVGWVKNQSDGTVVVEAEGEREKLQKLVDWLRNHPGGSKIASVTDLWSDGTGEFTDFVIQHESSLSV